MLWAMRVWMEDEERRRRERGGGLLPDQILGRGPLPEGQSGTRASSDGSTLTSLIGSLALG